VCDSDWRWPKEGTKPARIRSECSPTRRALADLAQALTQTTQPSQTQSESQSTNHVSRRRSLSIVV
jgi:hypothetical protein